MMHTKWHWACCAKPVARMVLWAAGALSLLMAWVAVWRRGLVLNLEPLAWYWNALVLGVLASGLGTGDDCCGMCEMDGDEEKKM